MESMYYALTGMGKLIYVNIVSIKFLLKTLPVSMESN